MKRFLLLAISLFASVAFSQATEKTLMIQLKVTDDRYELQDAWLLPQVFPALADSAQHNGLRWTLVDDNKSPIAEGWIADPQKVSGAFVPNPESSTGGYHHLGEHRMPAATVIIRVPYDERMKTLVVERQNSITINASANTLTSAANASAQPAPKPADKAEFLLKPREVK